MAFEIKSHSTSKIETRIFTIRGSQVMIDRDLAELYEVETKALNQAVKRNAERFPESFRFQISEEEYNELVTNYGRFENLRSQFVTSSFDVYSSPKYSATKHHGGRRYLPYAFTEQGVAMLSAVLRSETAVKVSIQIMGAFVEMRRVLLSNASLLQRVEKMEFRQHLTDQNFERVFSALESNKTENKQDIFFNGQIYDAYAFVNQLIQKAQKKILLIDNYVDHTVLDMFTRKKRDVNVDIVTLKNTRLKAIDIKKFNDQYPHLSVNHSQEFHDRFLLLDERELYHIGASIKDLGKKCFAFSRMEDERLIKNLLSRL